MLRGRTFRVRNLIILVLAAALVLTIYRSWLFMREYTNSNGPYTSLLAPGDVVILVDAEGLHDLGFHVGARLRVVCDPTDSDSVYAGRVISLEELAGRADSKRILVAKRRQLRLASPAW
jgi:hypothetical protein